MTRFCSLSVLNFLAGPVAIGGEALNGFKLRVDLVDL